MPFISYTFPLKRHVRGIFTNLHKYLLVHALHDILLQERLLAIESEVLPKAEDKQLDLSGYLQSPLLCLEPHSKPARDPLHESLPDLRPQRCSDPEVTSPNFDPGTKHVSHAFYANTGSWI